MSSNLDYWITKQGSDFTTRIPSQYPQHRRTKIVVTLGPSTQAVGKIMQLIDAGVDVFRLNFSHGTHDYHKQTILNIREAAEKVKRRRHVGIMLDTKGPEIRTGLLADNQTEVALEEGQTLTITVNEEYISKCSSEVVYVDYKNMPNKLPVGNLILIDDGLIACKVEEINGSDIKCTVLNSGSLGSKKGVNLPGVVTDLPAITEQDEKDLKFGVRMGVDFVAASFVRKPSDVHAVRETLGAKGENIMIISKIENAEGLENFDEILKVTDGVMVARGDMGVEIPLEQVALAQKMMIAKCNIVGKPVITATQMLESMIVNPRPTRAEATDIANAVMDGSDAVMLSGETAKGKYPVEAVKTMATICIGAEETLTYNDMFNSVRAAVLQNDGKISVTETIASSAVKITNDIDAKVLITITETGTTARLCSKYRPKTPLYAITQNKETARRLCVSWGVNPVLVGSVIGTDSIVKRTLLQVKEDNFVRTGDLFVMTSGRIEATPGQTSQVSVGTV